MQRETRPPKHVTILHAGSLTTLVREHLGPALQQSNEISLESVPGHSVALATALKERRLRGDVYLSADAGQTFHGKPISFSAAIVNDAADPQVALRVVTFLLSEAGSSWCKLRTSCLAPPWSEETSP